jgi:hypothetical protein
MMSAKGVSKVKPIHYASGDHRPDGGDVFSGEPWSSASWLLQLLAIVSASTFGVLAVISKGRKGALSKPDKFLVAGSVVAGFVGVAVLIATMRADERRESTAETKAVSRLNKNIEREQRLLSEIERQEFQISNYGAVISYEVSASDPALVAAVGQWKNYLAALDPHPHFLGTNYFTGPDSHVTLVRDAGDKVTEMRILTSSKLFPKMSPEDAKRFFPILFVRVLRVDAPEPTHYTDSPANLLYPRKDEDLSFVFMANRMLRTDQTTSSAEAPIVQGYLSYHPKDGTVEVVVLVNTKNQLRTYTGAITSLVDLPGRVLEVDVVSIAPVIRIRRIALNTRVGHLDDRGGTATIEATNFTEVTGSGGVMATHRLTRGDFPLLAHTDETEFDKPSH